MNAEQLKERLSCYRPGIDDPEDALFASALNAAERDPALAEWLREQQEFDAAMRGHLNAANLPEGLCESLKKNAGKPVVGYNAGDDQGAAAAAGTDDASSGGKIIRPVWWKRVAVAAAAVVVGLLALNSLNHPASAVESFRNDMAKMATAGFPLDLKSGNLVKVRQWLASQNAPVYDECPPGIGATKGVGCRTFQWNDHTVSIICFQKETGKVVHMFVIERSALDDADEVPGGKMAMQQNEGLENGGWIDSKNVYLLVGSSSDVALDGLL